MSTENHHREKLMDWQLEAQIRDMEHDNAVVLATKVADFIKAAVDGVEDRYYVALIPRSGEVVATKDAA